MLQSECQLNSVCRCGWISVTFPCPFCPTLWSSPGTRSWPTVPRCTTTSTRSSRCSPWRSESPSEPRHAHLSWACVSVSWPSSLPAISASWSLCYPLNILWLCVSLCVTSADTGTSQKFLTQERQQMRRTRTEISQCMSVLGWHLWVSSALLSELLCKVLQCCLLSSQHNHPQCWISVASRKSQITECYWFFHSDHNLAIHSI